MDRNLTYTISGVAALTTLNALLSERTHGPERRSYHQHRHR